MKNLKKALDNAILDVAIICIVIFVFYAMICAMERKRHYKWHEYDDIRLYKDYLQHVLDSYVADERYSAIADTDEKMKAYKTIDEIIATELPFYNETEGLNDEEPYIECLKKIFEGRKEYGKNSYELLPSEQRFCFEEEVVRTFENYIEPEGNGRYLSEPRSKDFKGCPIWIWIQGSYEEGYTVTVLPYKKDPFSEVR